MARDRFEALDAWRGICALVVALEHFKLDSALHENPFVQHGYRFVDFFFVLSGFVIAHAYRGRLQGGGAETRAFLLRRIGRLWPLHVVVLLAFVGFELAVLAAEQAGFPTGRAAFTERSTLPSLVPNLILIHGWGLFDHVSWNGPSWSISAELFAYGLFAALCLAVRRRGLEVAAAALAVAAMLAVVELAPSGMRSTFDFGVPRCVFGFMVGVLVRALWGVRPLRLGTAGEVAVVLATIAGVALLPIDRRELLVVPLFAVAVWVFASEDGALSRQMRRAWPQRLGAWSYSIYMVHALVVMVVLAIALVAQRFGVALFARIDGVAALVGPPALMAAFAAGYLAIVVGIASLTYRFVELPGQRRFAAWARRAGR